MLTLLSAEQEMLQQLVGSLAGLAAITTPHDLDSVDVGAAWHALAESGVLALRQRADGRPAASGVEVLVAAEGLARQIAAVPYVGAAVLAADLLARAGRDDLVQEIAEGVVRYAVALTPDLAEVADCSQDAIAFDCAGADFVLSLGADGALVRRSAAGLVGLAGEDFTRGLAHVPAGDGEPIASVPAAERQRWLALALTALTADSVGTMRGSLDTVIDYSKTRVQFGVPVGSFQAIQHMCADAYVQVEATWSLAKYAAWAVDEEDPDTALTAARAAKAYAGRAALSVGEIVMQVYGGIGQTWECAAHLHLRRGLLDRVALGDETYQLDRLAESRLDAV